MHSRPRLLLDSLKRCPLCEAVSAEATTSCFVCGWAGAFDHDEEDVSSSLDALLAKCPDLAQYAGPTKKPTLVDRVRRLFLAGTRKMKSYARPGRRFDVTC